MAARSILPSTRPTAWYSVGEYLSISHRSFGQLVSVQRLPCIAEMDEGFWLFGIGFDVESGPEGGIRVGR